MDLKLLLLIALAACFKNSQAGLPVRIDIQVDDRFVCYAGYDKVKEGGGWGTAHEFTVFIPETPVVACISTNVPKSPAGIAFSTSSGQFSDGNTACKGFPTKDAAEAYRKQNPTSGGQYARVLLDYRSGGSENPWRSRRSTLINMNAKDVWAGYSGPLNTIPAGHSTLCYINLIDSIVSVVNPGTYLGCWQDDPVRVLKYRQPNSNTNSPQECIAKCRQKGFAFAGVEYSRECFCDQRVNEKVNYARIRPLPATSVRYNCNMNCPGSSQKCGGGWAIGVFKT